MSPDPIALRCTAPHPDHPGRICRAWLVNAVEGSVDVSSGVVLEPGCVEVKCPRCGERYSICPVRRSA